MKKRNRTPTLDLHDIIIDNHVIMEQVIEQQLDGFVHKYIHQKSGSLEIIVGKGLNSKRYIGGKNPLRYYTEQYLRRVGLSYRDSYDSMGGSGSIIVQW